MVNWSLGNQRVADGVNLVYFFALQGERPPHSPPRPPGQGQPCAAYTKTWGSQHLDMAHLLEYIEVLVSRDSHRHGCPPYRRRARRATALRVSRPQAPRPSSAALRFCPIHAITTPSINRRQVPRCGGRCTEHRRRRDARAGTRLAADSVAGRRLYRAAPSRDTARRRRKESAGRMRWCDHDRCSSKQTSQLASCPRGVLCGVHRAPWFSLVCSRAARLRPQQQHASSSTRRCRLSRGGSAECNPTKPPARHHQSHCLVRQQQQSLQGWSQEKARCAAKSRLRAGTGDMVQRMLHRRGSRRS
jgi:hypothetical protein